MGGKKLIIIIAIVVVVAIIGVLAAVLLLGGSKEPKEKPVEYLEYKFDEQYSNLADENSKKIVKYAVIVQYTDKEIEVTLGKNKTKLTNSIDEIMRRTNSDELSKKNGKERLRVRIQNMIIDTLELDDTIITDIFIEPFVIQG